MSNYNNQRKEDLALLAEVLKTLTGLAPPTFKIPGNLVSPTGEGPADQLFAQVRIFCGSSSENSRLWKREGLE
jgi:hypothetical protein